MQQTRRALLRLILRVNVLGKIPQCSRFTRFWLAWSALRARTPVSLRASGARQAPGWGGQYSRAHGAQPEQAKRPVHDPSQRRRDGLPSPAITLRSGGNSFMYKLHLSLLQTTFNQSDLVSCTGT